MKDLYAKPRHYLSGELENLPSVRLLHRYVDSDQEAISSACIDLLERRGGTFNYWTAGEMALQEAYDTNGLSERLAWLERSERNFKFSLEGELATKQIINKAAGQAMKQLACLPAYYGLLLGGRIVGAHHSTLVYERLLQAGESHIQAFKLHNSSDLSGNLSEIGVLLLLQRFGLQLGDSSWLALPATIVQEHRCPNPSSRLNSWDISVFTQYQPEVTPALSHKVQVKTSRRKRHRPYEPDIACVYLRENLSEKPQRLLSADTITKLCRRELEQPDDSEASYRLNQMTDKLLEILG